MTQRSYWASQLLYYCTYAVGGWNGIDLLRFVLAAALFAVMWKRRKGDAVVDAALLLVFAVAFLEKTAIERPQILSFLGFGLLLNLMDGLKKAPASARSPLSVRRSLIPIALLMLVWANVHGGFALGQAVIIVYLTAEGAKFGATMPEPRLQNARNRRNGGLYPSKTDDFHPPGDASSGRQRSTKTHWILAVTASRHYLSSAFRAQTNPALPARRIVQRALIMAHPASTPYPKRTGMPVDRIAGKTNIYIKRFTTPAAESALPQASPFRGFGGPR
jgi:hypothetical protein